jgi:MipA family protein
MTLASHASITLANLNFTAPANVHHPCAIQTRGVDFMMRSCFATVTVAVLLAPPFSHAEERATGISGNIGAGVGLVQEYEGGSDTRTVPIVLLEVTMPTRYGTFALGQDGLSWTPIEGNQFRAGVFATYDTGRIDDGSEEFRSGSTYLRGMGEIDETPEAGAFVSWTAAQVTTTLRASHAIGSKGHEGMKAQLSASMPLYTRSAFSLRAQSSVDWADSNYMQAYFGVTPLQASRTHFAAYEIGSGFNGVQVDLIGSYEFAPRWSVAAIASYRHLLGDAADSPIVQKTSYPGFALMVSRSWGKSP